MRWRNRRTGAETEGEIRNVFLFIGADPPTGWLDGCGVRLDKAGFVVTGVRCAESQWNAPSLRSNRAYRAYSPWANVRSKPAVERVRALGLAQ